MGTGYGRPLGKSLTNSAAVLKVEARCALPSAQATFMPGEKVPSSNTTYTQAPVVRLPISSHSSQGCTGAGFEDRPGGPQRRNSSPAVDVGTLGNPSKIEIANGDLFSPSPS